MRNQIPSSRFTSRMAGKPGPKPKGKRTPFIGRYPDDHLAVYKARAAAEGIPLGDYLARVMAEAHGLDEPSYLNRSRNQPELLLNTGA